MDGPRVPLAFTTAAADDIRAELRCPIIDFFDMHMSRVESILGVQGMHLPSTLHGVGDLRRYNARMQAVEYAIEHDDGQSLRALDKANIVLVAPSRCGKTPTTMYLAQQHGVMVANYPLVDEDFDSADLPRPIRAVADRCFGIVSTPERLSTVRHERRPHSRYTSLAQCTYELRRAQELFAAHQIPFINSATKSVEEMSTLILQRLNSSLGPERKWSRASHWPTPTSDGSPTSAWATSTRSGARTRRWERWSATWPRPACRFRTGSPPPPPRSASTSPKGDVADLIEDELVGLDTDDVVQLAQVGALIRAAIIAKPLPTDLDTDIRAAYAQLSRQQDDTSFAVRSSATAEDLPDASFAGQQETFLNVHGVDAVLQAVREVFASLYNDRAIAHRVHHAFDHASVALSAGVQRMVRSDLASSGVMFTMDTESGFTDAALLRRARRRTAPPLPVVETRPGHTQQIRHSGNRVGGLLRVHQPVRVYRL